MLAEPQAGLTASTYMSQNANRTLTVPVSFEMQTSGIPFYVSKVNVMGYSDKVGRFAGEEIVARKFREMVGQNFHLVQGDETPVAKFIVRVIKSTVKKEGNSTNTECNLEIQVDVKRQDDSAVAFGKKLDASFKKEWQLVTEVPLAFYGCLDKVIESFIANWDSGTATATLLKWNGERTPDKKPPELMAFNWLEEDDGQWTAKDSKVFAGECKVLSNDYDGMSAKAWANAHIAVACQTKLGNIEHHRVRVIYDEDKFDEMAKKWTFKFHTFARTKIWITFDKSTGYGKVTGDLGLMNVKAEDRGDVEKASEELKRFVLEEMASRAGAVSREVQKGKSLVRFDDIKMNKTYNLLTIAFHQVN